MKKKIHKALWNHSKGHYRTMCRPKTWAGNRIVQRIGWDLVTCRDCLNIKN